MLAYSYNPTIPKAVPRTNHWGRLNIKKLRWTILQKGLRGLHFVEHSLQRVGIIIALGRQFVDSTTKQTLQVLRTAWTPNPIATIMPARRCSGQIPHPDAHLGSPIGVNGRTVDLTGVSEPIADLGHGPVAFTLIIGIVGVVEVDIFEK